MSASPAPVLPPAYAGEAAPLAVAEYLYAQAGKPHPTPPAAAEMLGDLHARWAAPGSALRAEAVAALHASSGYAPRLLDESLRRFFRRLSAPRLRRVVRRELRPRTGELIRPARLTWVTAAGNVPVASLSALILATLAGAPCLYKPASAEPILPTLYARSLAESAPSLANRLAVIGWRGGDADLESALGRLAETVIAFGSDAALESLRSRIAPGAVWCGFGHRYSIACVTSAGMTAAAARGTARDVCAYDQQGCMSPLLCFCAADSSATAAFGERLALALARLSRRWPRRPLSLGEAAAIRRWRAGVELRAALGRGRQWLSEELLGWTVALLPEADLRDAGRDRSLVLISVSGEDDLAARLRPGEGRLSTASLACAPEERSRWTQRLLTLGATRLCAPGRMQFPNPLAPHEGRSLCASLIRRISVGR